MIELAGLVLSVDGKNYLDNTISTSSVTTCILSQNIGSFNNFLDN